MVASADFLYCILAEARKPLSQTKLIKLACMADLAAWRVLGAPISEFCYKRDDYGPFDLSFYAAIERLKVSSHRPPRLGCP